jgi:NDP-sugar pyrophosphorylase family protein
MDWPKPLMKVEDKEMMRVVLAEYCAEHGLAVESLEATRKAQELVDWFEFGIRRPDEMAMMIRPL